MKKAILVMAMIVLGAVLVYAVEDIFMKLDNNKDGKISKQEYLDAVSGKFDKMDVNHDQVLTKEEIQAGGKADAEKIIKAVKPNREGKITKDMFMKAAEKQFKSIDENQSGYIEINEWKKAGSLKNPPALILFTF